MYYISLVPQAARPVWGTGPRARVFTLHQRPRPLSHRLSGDVCRANGQAMR